MLYRCEYCEKRASVGRKVSHAKNRSRKISLPNLHYKRILFGDKWLRMRLCTRCIRNFNAKAEEKLAGVSKLAA